MENNVIHQDAFRKPKLIFAIQLIVFGLLNVIFTTIYALPIALFGAAILLFSSGLEINVSEQSYRIFKSFGNKR